MGVGSKIEIRQDIEYRSIGKKSQYCSELAAAHPQEHKFAAPEKLSFSK